METYTCCMCKESFGGTPAWENNCGVFCPKCKQDVHERAKAGYKARKNAVNGYCIWCGQQITEATKQSGKNVNVCMPCENRREWLLTAIRLSERPARYVARVEEREAPLRAEREKIMQNSEPAKAHAMPSEQDARLARLERMMNKLVESLGV